MCRYIQMKLRITFLLYDTARQQRVSAQEKSDRGQVPGSTFYTPAIESIRHQHQCQYLGQAFPSQKSCRFFS